MTDNIASLVDDFLSYLEAERGLGAKAVENYGRYVRRFTVQSGVYEPSDITAQVLKRYGAALHGNMAMSTVTKNYHLIALRAFLKYLHACNISSLPHKKVTLEPHLRNRTAPLSAAESTRLCDAVTGTHEVAVRDRAILHVLRATKVRVGELCALNIHDVSGARIRVHEHGVPKTVHLSPEAVQALQMWLSVRRSADPALFLNVGRHTARTGSLRLTPRSVQRIVKRYAKQSGLKDDVTPERLRRVV